MKLTIDVKQREKEGANNEEKNNNSCAIKKNITGIYTEDESTFLVAASDRREGGVGMVNKSTWHLIIIYDSQSLIQNLRS